LGYKANENNRSVTRVSNLEVLKK